jgi:dTDP-4-dehydrorhamnose reductase
MRVLIIGASGQLGSDLCRVYQDREIIPLNHRDIEITDINSVRTAILAHRPQLVINTAAYIRVDDCESEKDKAFAVNALGAGNVATVCREIDARLALISTDYVFGGGTPADGIPLTEFDTPVPLNVYGRSKLAGEHMVSHLCHKYYIIRTSGLFGTAGASGKGGNFIETILNLSRTKKELNVVDDQIFSPTYSLDLAEIIHRLLDTEYYGIFHITNSGSCSWYEFSRAITGFTGTNITINPVHSDQYPQKASRPGYSVLNNYHLQLAGIDKLRPWQAALKDYLNKKGYISQEAV